MTFSVTIDPYRRTSDRITEPRLAIVVGAGYGRMCVVTEDGECWEPNTPGACADVWKTLGQQRKVRVRQTPKKRAAGKGRTRLERRGGREWRVYASARTADLYQTVGASQFTAERWTARVNKLTHADGAVIYPLTPLRGLPMFDAAQGFFDFADWVRDWRHVRFDGTLATIGFRLWRSTMQRPALFVGNDECDAAQAFFGGRQEAPFPGEHTDMCYFDLTAAYPHAMVSEGFGESLVEIDPSTDPHDFTGICLASVVVDATDGWNPLPMRLGTMAMIYGNTQPARGWWSARELAMAAERGHYVRIDRAFATFHPTDLFGPAWLETVIEGRGLSTPATTVAKACANSTWGRFASRAGSRDVVTWADWDGKRVATRMERPALRLPIEAAMPVAVEVTARVRERLFREGLGAGTGAIYCDTDAYIAPPGGRPATGLTDGLGGWKIRSHMSRLEIHAPQVLRWFPRGETAAWRYTVSGVDPDEARRNFQSYGRRFHRRAAAPPNPVAPFCLPPGELRLARQAVEDHATDLTASGRAEIEKGKRDA